MNISEFNEYSVKLVTSYQAGERVVDQLPTTVEGVRFLFIYFLFSAYYISLHLFFKNILLFCFSFSIFPGFAEILVNFCFALF